MMANEVFWVHKTLLKVKSLNYHDSHNTAIFTLWQTGVTFYEISWDSKAIQVIVLSFPICFGHHTDNHQHLQW